MLSDSSMSFEAVSHPFFIRICARSMGIALFFRFVDRLLLIQEMVVAGRQEIMTLFLFI
jgi:hypothetical protein